MDEFNALRVRARQKRDKLIEEARSDYHSALIRITALEHDLRRKHNTQAQAIAQCVNRVIPSDRGFTIPEIMQRLEELDGSRVWFKQSVDRHISRLRRQGISPGWWRGLFLCARGQSGMMGGACTN
jgi:hypothetical protein